MGYLSWFYQTDKSGQILSAGPSNVRAKLNAEFFCFAMRLPFNVVVVVAAVATAALRLVRARMLCQMRARYRPVV